MSVESTPKKKPAIARRLSRPAAFQN